ncbi:MAG: multidrug effflux MFS transporter [Chlamydiota bacterium]
MNFRSQKKQIAIVLFMMVTLGQLGVDLYLPSMPHIATSLHSSVSLIKLTIPLYLLGFGVSQLFYGPISDNIGRKPILHFGLALFLISSLGALFSTNALMLIVFRTLQGLGIGAAIVNVRAVMRDAFHGKQMAKVSAQIAMTWSVTPIVAPVFGGYIQSYLGWRVNFSAMFFYAALAWLLIFLLLPETLDRNHRKLLHIHAVLKTYKNIFTDKVFLSFSLMSALCYGYLISYATASPFLFQTQLGLTPVQYGWAILAIACGTVMGSIICSRVVSYVKITHIIFLGSFLMVASTCILFFLSLSGVFNAFSLLIPPFFATLGGGMVLPNCTTGAMTHYKKNAGVAGASLGFVQMSISFCFSMIISRLPTKNSFPLSIELLIISILIFFLFLFYIQPRFQEELGETAQHTKN